MWRSVEGVYRDGRVDLSEPAPGDKEASGDCDVSVPWESNRLGGTRN